VSLLWPALLLAATGLHAGFQASVTVLVYPALAEAPPERWHEVHDRHSRRIVALVAMVYAAVLVSCVGAVADDPSSVLLWVAALASVATVLVTATAAAPLHGRLGAGWDPTLLSRLLVVDRLRCGCALLAFAATVLAVTVR
jgi:hypothetical protein